MQPSSARRTIGPLLVSQLVVVLVTSAAIVGGGYFFVINAFRVPRPDDPRPIVPSTGQSTQTTDGTTDYDAFRFAQNEIVSKSRVLARQIQTRMLKQQVEDAATSLTDEIARLEGDERGRRIAADQASLRRFIVLYDSAKPVLKRVKALCVQLEQLGSPALASGTEIDDLETQVMLDLAELDRSRAVLAGIIMEAQRNPVARTSLEATATNWGVWRNKERLRLIDEQIKKSKSMLADKLTSASADVGKASDDLTEMQRLLKNQQDVKLANEAEQRDLAETQERLLANHRAGARKDLEDVLQDIRNQLTPFITPGYTQPKSKYELETTVEKAPVSYAALLRVGALESDQEGLHTLLRIGGSKRPGYTNDRALGRFPQYLSDLQLNELTVIRDLQFAQRLLREHGQAMVEAGLLSP